ncbi:hypothetical protein [Limnohabitans sp. 2KL-3]|uniref:hypothetical protein n=1 Tax=Limnohabitans sp. 2KL-3 TaxID=1100700 RepID=UPI001892C66F|nr:hypothetical protein [Limnohabitans sp. 2KL-3]
MLWDLWHLDNTKSLGVSSDGLLSLDIRQRDHVKHVACMNGHPAAAEEMTWPLHLLFD